MITFGHTNVWDYGYSFFKEACLAVCELQKQFVVLMSSSIGLAFCGKEEIEKFIKDSENGTES